MDGISAASVAKELGTSIPRVIRAVERLNMSNARAPNGRLELSEAQKHRLRKHLGVTPRVAGLTEGEVKALAALSRAPLGLVSARALATRAGISPTTASRALRSLREKDLVRREKRTIAAGRAREVEIWQANVLRSDWPGLAAALSTLEPAEHGVPARRDRCVPARLRHLFWDSSSSSSLEVGASGPFIALRLLRLRDPEGLAWGIANLHPLDWRHAAKARGLSPSIRTLAKNLAGEG